VAWRIFGDARSTSFSKQMEENTALPAPPPPPGASPPVFLTPNAKDSSSISPLCLLSLLSPSMPSIFRNTSAFTSVGALQSTETGGLPAAPAGPCGPAGPVSPCGPGIPCGPAGPRWLHWMEVSSERQSSALSMTRSAPVSLL
jgi:hypothetical protein